MSRLVHPGSQYYLHTNGEVIFKTRGGVVVDPGGFVVQVWDANAIGRSPQTYRAWLSELCELGASRNRLLDLWDKQCLCQFLGDGSRDEFLLEIEGRGN